MGLWYDSRVFESAWPQVESTVQAIMADPYLMPPCPIFYQIFEDMADQETASLGWPQRKVRDLIKAVVKSLHNAVMNLGAGDYEIDLLEFWKFLVVQGEKDGYSHFVFLQCEGEPGGIQDMEIQYLIQPLCIWAKMKYLHATQAYEAEGFLLGTKTIIKPITGQAGPPRLLVMGY